MKALRGFILILTALTLRPVYARALDEARALSGQIEYRTGGKVKIIHENADDDSFGDVAAVKLRIILTGILSDKSRDLREVTPAQIGDEVVAALARTANPESVLPQGEPTSVDLEKARVRFCALSSEPCLLFSNSISAALCGLKDPLTTPAHRK